MIRRAIIVTALAACGDARAPVTAPRTSGVLTGKAALGDWTTDAPGVRRTITAADLPPPFDTPSADNGPEIVSRPEGAWPRVPAGFRVELYIEGLTNPRMIRTAPNGDLFVVESDANRVKVLRGKEAPRVFATDLKQPFGIAFYPPGNDPKWVYVANTDSVVRFPYPAGGAPEVVIDNVSAGRRLRG